MNRWISGGLGLGLALFIACKSQQPTPSGRLVRPSGLAYAKRSSGRFDLFIADSEAEGIRVLQTRKTIDSQGNERLERAFLLAPSVYFPLVISTPGFPSRLAISQGGTRLYALAPTSRSLYVIDATEKPFGSTATSEGRDVRLDIQLDRVSDPSWVPVDIDVMPGADPNRDIVLVAFDVLGQESSRLVAFEIVDSGSSIALDPAQTMTATIAPSPRDLLVHGAEVVVSSARASFVSVVSTSTTGGPLLGRMRAVEAGGPTSVLVDGRTLGVFASRLDEPLLAIFRQGPAGLEPGVAALPIHASPIAGGDFGALQSLVSAQENGAVDLLEGRRSLPDPMAPSRLLAPVVALAHADATLSFVLPRSASDPTPVVAVQRSAHLARLSAIAGELGLTGCGDVLSCATENPAEPSCPAELVTSEASASSSLTLRVTFNGALARWHRPPGPAGAMSEMAPIALISRPGADPTVAIDVAGSGFDARRVRPQDLVQLQAEVPTGCDALDTSIDLVGTAIVDRVEPTRLSLSLGPTSSSTLAARLGQLEACPGAVRWYSYEVFPRERELVIATADATSVLAVYDRIALTSTGAVPLALDAVGSFTLNTRVEGRFECEEVATPGAPCVKASDCVSSSCEATAFCGGTCQATACPDGMSGCLTREVSRRCSSLEMVLAPPVSFAANLARDSDFVPTAPDQVLFDPLRPGFFVSFPGGREIVEAHVAQENHQVALDRIR